MDTDKIENYSEHREKFISKGRGTAFMTAVRHMDEYIAQPTVFQSNARATHVQIKTERDVENQLNIKQEKIDVVARRSNASKPQDKSNVSWQREKQNLVQQIVSLKAESQKYLLELKNKQSECSSLFSKNQELVRQFDVQVSELDAVKKTLTIQADENMRNKKIILDLSRENQLLQARNKQLQTGIDQNSQQKNSIAKDVQYEVEKILEQKKQKGVWLYKIRWKGYGAEHDTWEKESNLKCPKILKAFKKTVAEDKK